MNIAIDGVYIQQPGLKNGKKFWQAETTTDTIYLRWASQWSQWIFDNDFDDAQSVRSLVSCRCTHTKSYFSIIAFRTPVHFAWHETHSLRQGKLSLSRQRSNTLISAEFAFFF